MEKSLRESVETKISLTSFLLTILSALLVLFIIKLLIYGLAGLSVLAWFFSSILIVLLLFYGIRLLILQRKARVLASLPEDIDLYQLTDKTSIAEALASIPEFKSFEEEAFDKDELESIIDKHANALIKLKSPLLFVFLKQFESERQIKIIKGFPCVEKETFKKIFLCEELKPNDCLQMKTNLVKKN